MDYEPRAPREGINVTLVHPAREAVTLVAGIAAVIALLTGVAAFGVDLAVRAIPPEFEARHFAALAPNEDGGAQGGGERGVLARALLERLARHCPEAPYRFRLVIDPGPEPNAAALPGGVVLVTQGLLDAARSENELAFVLGHELGHFHGRHHLRRLGRAVVMGLAFAALLGQSGDPGDLAALTGEITSRGFDRGQESDADAFGIGLVAAEYGHLGGAFDIFERLEGRPLGGRLPAYFQTHPAMGDRVAALKRQATERALLLDGAPRPLP